MNMFFPHPKFINTFLNHPVFQILQKCIKTATDKEPHPSAQTNTEPEDASDKDILVLLQRCSLQRRSKTTTQDQKYWLASDSAGAESILSVKQ